MFQSFRLHLSLGVEVVLIDMETNVCLWSNCDFYFMALPLSYKILLMEHSFHFLYDLNQAPHQTRASKQCSGRSNVLIRQSVHHNLGS